MAIFLQTIDEKLAILMKKKTKPILDEDYDDEEVEAALNDEQMRQEVEKHLNKGAIKLVHKNSGKQVFVNETNLLQEKGKKGLEAIEESIDYERNVKPGDAELVSVILINAIFYSKSKSQQKRS